MPPTDVLARTAARRTTAFRFYTGTLGAGLSIDLEAYGDFIFLVANSGASNTLELSFGNTQNQKIPVGLIIKTDEIFNRVTLKNGDVGNTTYTLIVGQGYIDYKALVIGNTVTVSTAQSSVGTDAALVTTGAAAKVWTTIPNKRALFQALSTNTGSIFLSYAITASATRFFFELLPGAAYEADDLNMDIFAFSVGAQSLAVSSRV